MKRLINDAKGIYASVGGSLPNAPHVAAKFKQSGFFAGFTNPPADLPEPQGMMRRKSSVRVDSEVAGELVQFAMEHANVPQAIAEASYKNLVELMGNTHNHAGQRSGVTTHRARWQASVYCEDTVAYFNFVDLGVGITRSTAPRSFLKSLGATLFGYGEPRLLEDTFRGIIGASADKPGRGFGFTRMREAAEAGLLPQLRVITLSAKGEVAGLRFEKTGATLRGTMFRWTTANPSTES